MSIITSQTSYQGPNGRVDAVVARPQQEGPRPALLVLHEGLGLTRHIVGLLERIAGEGYVAFAPNLYSHDKLHAQFDEAEVAAGIRLSRLPDRDAELAKLSPEGQRSAKRVFTWLAKRDTSTYFGDALAAVRHLRDLNDVRPEALSAIGFSLGGGLVADLARSGAELAGGIVFYGSLGAAEKARDVGIALQVHLGGEDPGVTVDATGIIERLRAEGKDVEAHVYPGAGHGFFNETRPTYHAAAADLAWRRSLEFLDLRARRARRAA
jgi:carboxymethylenebutenolidase